MPCGMVRVGSTTTVRSASFWACSAAIIMFLLLGSTNTVLAGTLCTAARISAVAGFIVCPPLTTASAPKVHKHGLQALARRHGHKAIGALRIYRGIGKFRAGGFFPRPRPAFSGPRPASGAPGTARACSHFKIGQISIFDGVADDFAWVCRVHMAVDDLVIFNHHHRIAIRFQKMPAALPKRPPRSYSLRTVCSSRS